MLDDTDAPGGALESARSVHRPSAVHVEVRAPNPRDPDWRLSGAGPTPGGRGHLWLTGELADTLLASAGITAPPEVEGGHNLAVFVTGDGGGGLVLRLVSRAFEERVVGVLRKARPQEEVVATCRPVLMDTPPILRQDVAIDPVSKRKDRGRRREVWSERSGRER